MTKPKFLVEFNIENGLTYVAPKNNEAKELYEEISKEIPNQPFIKFILLSPNSMDMDKDGNLIYDIDTTNNSEVIKELKGI